LNISYYTLNKFKNLFYKTKNEIEKNFPDIDTDELDSDTKNMDEEVVEFFVKEESFIIDDK
jgi:hypothetical protein